MTNAYPEKPILPYARTQVAMTDVIEYLQATTLPLEVKRSVFVIFRNESANGTAGVNNNYIGAQADGSRWPAKWDNAIAGIVDEAENGTNLPRLFLAFYQWTTSVDLLADRLAARGLYVGGRVTSPEGIVDVTNDAALARCYYKSWVRGDWDVEPTAEVVAAFRSMYSQAAALFRVESVEVGAPVAAPVPAAEPTADDLNAAELGKINEGETT